MYSNKADWNYDIDGRYQDNDGHSAGVYFITFAPHGLDGALDECRAATFGTMSPA